MPRAGPMPIISISSTQDLRSHAQDRKRERENKAKWSPKWGEIAGLCTAKVGPNDTLRPVKLQSQKSAAKGHVHREKFNRKTHEQKKRPTLNDNDDSTPDSSADEELINTNAVNVDNYTYSYDAPRGPAHGNEILEMAVNKAVERFEDQVTVKLVNDEYEFLDAEEDEPAAAGHNDSDDDDFELI